MDSDAEAMTAELAEQLASNERIDPRSVPVRFSRLKRMALSPAHYLHSVQRSGEDADRLEYRLGSGVHAIVLGKPVIRYSGRRAGKAWDLFAVEHADKVILNDREWAEAQAMASAITRNREACTLLWEGTTIETEIRWRHLGRECSSTPDAITRHHVAELKTSRTAHPSWFVREALRFHYHVQLQAYRLAALDAHGWSIDAAYVVAVEKDPPYPITIFRLTDRALDEAHNTWSAWFQQLLVCEEADQWPEYASALVDFDVPELDVLDEVIA